MVKMAIYLPLLAFVLLTNIVEARIPIRSPRVNQYASIDKWLEENVKSLDPETNVRKAEEYFNSPAADNMSEDEQAKWYQFIELSVINENNMCNQGTIYILDRNSIAVNVDRKLNVEYDSRTQYVVMAYVKWHSKNCQNVYSAFYEDDLQNMEPKVLQVLDDIEAFYMQSKLVGRPTGGDKANVWLGFPQFKIYNSLLKLNSMAVLVDYISERYATEQQRDMLNHVHNYKRDKNGIQAIQYMVEDLIHTPHSSCSSYMDQLGDLFDMASFDAVSKNYPTYGTQRFLGGWQKYEICKTIVQGTAAKTASAIVELLSQRKAR